MGVAIACASVLVTIAVFHHHGNPEATPALDMLGPGSTVSGPTSTTFGVAEDCTVGGGEEDMTPTSTMAL
eukprot:NODE_7287_length_449_cov_242.492386.p4 GENE.NODE_7287_length_449_cov_242.492386~~NODE_7287_length_449_cov_242.492386.p4  ORF type:complete len:70 (+),score=10.84 NODE_7287_length_449_cov_242.492386:3-212(+)